MSATRAMRSILLVFLALVVVLGGCAPRTGPDPVDEGPTVEKRIFDGARAYRYALDQCEIGPRPPGTEAGWATGDFIIDRLLELGWEVETEEFEYQAVQLRNVIGKRGEGPVVILGAHYDTRPVADRDPDPENVSQPIIGGNDGASGVAVLLELADVLSQYELENEVWLAFFDGEDSGHLDGWPFCVGSAYMAEHLTVEPAWVIVVDMVGDADQQLYYEGGSDKALRERLWGIAGDLGYETFVPEVRYSIFDDHVPFLSEGIPAVDIIDFDYPYWHTIGDTCEKVSPESLEKVGRVLEELLVVEE
jgi:glutaminyl-peptide cyclotransferase